MNQQQRNFLLALCGYAAMREIPIQGLAMKANVDLRELLANEKYEVSRDQAHQLWSICWSECNDQHFGLHFGESLQLGALGVVGEIIKSSKTVGQAISIAASLTPAVTDLYTMEVVRKEGVKVNFNPTSNAADPEMRKHMLDFLIVFTIQELDGLLFRKVRPDMVVLPFEADQEYERVLRCKPNFGEQVSIQFDEGIWHELVITSNYEIQRDLLRSINIQTEESESFQSRVKDYLAKNAYLKLLTLEDVAANFNMTARSLQRRLQQESTSFQQIADTVRSSLAIEYIQRGKYQFGEIADLLGYNDLSAFSRAFKRWTGKAPQDFSV
ncbi:MAG: AraC family transcriptional regulator ligand-binding domain-containing protein [Cyclobacteriaceae bacterium]